MNNDKNIFLSCILTVIILFNALQIAGQGHNTSQNFENESLLHPLFDKLYSLKDGGREKVNIVHIGDSHIQADFFTNAIRHELQSYFGNGGYGFTFPYSVAKTNGTKVIRYATNTDWQAARNIDRASEHPIGLGGISLSASETNFLLTLTADSPYNFNTIKIISAGKEACFTVSQKFTDNNNISVRQTQKKTSETYHIVKNGETLYRLSVNYKVPVNDIKKANNLSSNTIKTGQKIKIPQKIKTSDRTAATYCIEASDSLLLIYGDYYTSYHSPVKMNGATVLAGKNYRECYLNGIVLENDAPGILYHSIGINGAKASDFNKYPLFFDQLSILKPDIIIISLGTNESFGKWSPANYINEIGLLTRNIRARHENIPIIITTPPPSLLKRRLSNTLLIDYKTALKQIKNCAIWDLHSKMGGSEAPKKKKFLPLMAKDKIHYTKEGYQMQGNMLSADLLNSYKNYIKVKSTTGHDIRETEQTVY